MKTTMLILAGLLVSLPVFTDSTSSTTGSPPNLCDEVYLGEDGGPIHDSTGRTLSRHCEWTGPDAPIFDSEVCCEVDDAGAACSLPEARGRCSFGERYWCEYGEATALGGVVCYQPLPDACDAGYCVEAPTDPPTGEPFVAMCCGAGGCFPAEVGDHCDGEFVVCKWGISNTDGTVECFD